MTKTVFSILTEHEEFFVLFQRETLSVSLNWTVNFGSFLLIPPEEFCKINFAYFTGEHLCWSPFLIKLQSLTWNFRKETLAQVFSGDFFEFFESFFYKIPPGACFCCSIVFSTFKSSQLTYNGSSHQIMFRRMRVSVKNYEK